MLPSTISAWLALNWGQLCITSPAKFEATDTVPSVKSFLNREKQPSATIVKSALMV